MATNKKKSSGKTKEKKAVATAAATKDGVSSSSAPKPVPPATIPQQLSMPQLTALIFLSMGASRILQVRSAFLLTAEGKASGICVEHLGGEAPCTDATILALLQYKYGTALQCLLIAAAAVVQCWFLQPEAILSQLNALFTISPIAVGLAAMKVSPSIGTGPLWKQAAVCLVLGMLALPTSRANVPFWGSQIKMTSRKKTLPAMVLGGLAVLNLLQAVNYIGVTMESEWVVDWMLPLQPESIYQLASSVSDDDEHLKTAATPILYFLAVDCLTLALIFAFGWHALPDANQRVRDSRLHGCVSSFHDIATELTRFSLSLSLSLAFLFGSLN